jgi:hypothetical protein
MQTEFEQIVVMKAEIEKLQGQLSESVAIGGALYAMLKEQNDAVIELLNAESDKNERQITVRDGVKYYPIGGDLMVNQAFYNLCNIAERANKMLNNETAPKEKA